MGCYQDPNIQNSSFPTLILKPILPLLNESKTWSLRGEAWNTFLEDFVCSCAQRAKQLNYNYFGLKRFGKSNVRTYLFKNKNRDGTSPPPPMHMWIPQVTYFDIPPHLVKNVFVFP